MTLYEIATQLCRLKECNDFPIKYKRDVERMIHALNQINTYTITHDINIYPEPDEEALKMSDKLTDQLKKYRGWHGNDNEEEDHDR